MRIISILTVLVFSSLMVFSCKKNNHLFSYDKVEYYHTDSVFLPTYYDLEFGVESIPFAGRVNVKNIKYYNNLSNYFYKKHDVTSDFNDSLSLLFINKKPERNYIDHRCFHFYNDILIFYENTKIVGIAKFDFKCRSYYYTSFTSNQNIYLISNCEDYKDMFVPLKPKFDNRKYLSD